MSAPEEAALWGDFVQCADSLGATGGLQVWSAGRRGTRFVGRKNPSSGKTQLPVSKGEQV